MSDLMISNQSPAMTQRLQQVIERLKSLPAAEQDRLADVLMAAIEESTTEDAPRKGLPGDVLLEMTKQAIASIPESEWSKLPTDGAAEHDHYLYGSPKRYS